MKARTIKTENDWSYSFRKRNDGTIIIIQKNLKQNIHRDIHIFGEDVLAVFEDIFYPDVKPRCKSCEQKERVKKQRRRRIEKQRGHI